MYKVAFVSLFCIGVILVGCAQSRTAVVERSSEVAVGGGFTVAKAPVTPAVKAVEAPPVLEAVDPLAGNLSKCKVKTHRGKTAEIVCGKETASGVPSMPFSTVCDCVEDSGSSVGDIVAEMDRTGFKTVRAIASCGEVVGSEERKVRLNDKTFVYKAITYKAKAYSCFADRVAVYSVKDANGVDATPLEELLLILEKRIPFNAYSGLWFPHRTWGPAAEFGYGKIGANPKIEEVMTLPDGRVIKHITQDGVAPYFAIETRKMVKSKRVESREIQGDAILRERGRDRYVFPTEKELLERGIIPEGGRVLQVIGVSEIDVDNVLYATKTVAVVVEENKPLVWATCYPYDR